ncbi:MAG: hypothetical protein WBA68_06285 [Alteraurantiacibacter sp.]
MRRFFSVLAGVVGLVLVSPLVAPQVLAFPYHVESDIGTVWSERPFNEAALESVTARTQALLAESPIAEPDERRPIFLTDGGWRWLWLANTSRGGFGLTRPVSKAVIINRSDIATDHVENALAERSLSAVLAHEFVHGIQRRRYGLGMIGQPTWKTEGYADHVAQESTLTPEQAADLRARGESHPALVYIEGRQRVEKRLAENGGDVDALFATRD